MAMNNGTRRCIGFVNRGMSQRFRRRNRVSFVSERISLKITGYHFRTSGDRQLGQAASCRAGDVKIPGGIVSHTQVAEADAVWGDADQLQLAKFPPAFVEIGNARKWRDFGSRAFVCELYICAHDACSGKSE